MWLIFSDQHSFSMELYKYTIILNTNNNPALNKTAVHFFFNFYGITHGVEQARHLNGYNAYFAIEI